MSLHDCHSPASMRFLRHKPQKVRGILGRPKFGDAVILGLRRDDDSPTWRSSLREGLGATVITVVWGTDLSELSSLVITVHIPTSDDAWALEGEPIVRGAVVVVVVAVEVDGVTLN